MKKLRVLFAVLIISCFGLTFFSCNTSGVSPTNYARLQVVNALAGSTPVYFLLNSVRKYTSTVTYPYSSGYISITPDTTYVRFQYASSTLSLDNPVNEATDQHMIFRLDSSYTVFLTGTTSQYTTIRAWDDLSSPAAGKAKIRFVNASTGTTALDIYINGTKSFTNVGYKGIAAFTEVPAGTYEFKANYTGTSNTIYTLSTQTLANGKVYTLYAAGLVSSTASNAVFGLNLITNLAPAVK